MEFLARTVKYSGFDSKSRAPPPDPHVMGHDKGSQT